MKMKEKLQPLTLIRALIDLASIEKGTPIYDVEKEFQNWVIEKASILLSRYKQRHPKLHWTNKQERNMLIGMCGQLAFQRLLEYLRISHDADNPSEPVKPYDFKLSIGTIEIKTYDYYCRKAIIKETEWKGSDFLVVWQITDKTGDHISLKGWLPKKEVEKYPVIPKGASQYTPYRSARVIDLSDLNKPQKFLTKLREAKAKMFTIGEG